MLDAIGLLDDGSQERLRDMEAKLAKIYDTQGTWKEIVSEQMEFSSSFPDKLRRLWSQYRAEMEKRGVPVDALAFAMSFNDQNFPMERCGRPSSVPGVPTC